MKCQKELTYFFIQDDLEYNDIVDFIIEKIKHSKPKKLNSIKLNLDLLIFSINAFLLDIIIFLFKRHIVTIHTDKVQLTLPGSILSGRPGW